MNSAESNVASSEVHYRSVISRMDADNLMQEDWREIEKRLGSNFGMIEVLRDPVTKNIQAANDCIRRLLLFGMVSSSEGERLLAIKGGKDRLKEVKKVKDRELKGFLAR